MPKQCFDCYVIPDWNYQYKPGPYPKTPEEYAASAKRYGLTLEEYHPYPEDMGYGDYPKLPDVGEDSRDPHYPWDFPELKRNFGEPVRQNHFIHNLFENHVGLVGSTLTLV